MVQWKSHLETVKTSHPASFISSTAAVVGSGTPSSDSVSVASSNTEASVVISTVTAAESSSLEDHAQTPSLQYDQATVGSTLGSVLAVRSRTGELENWAVGSIPLVSGS